MNKIGTSGRRDKTSPDPVDVEMSFASAIQSPCVHYKFVDASCLLGAVYIARSSSMDVEERVYDESTCGLPPRHFGPQTRAATVLCESNERKAERDPGRRVIGVAMLPASAL
jgi:hypothetical protein